jgi:predicted phage gp36 major capsid-like protein
MGRGSSEEICRTFYQRVEAVKKHIKNWRDYMKRQVREAERATKASNNHQDATLNLLENC